MSIETKQTAEQEQPKMDWTALRSKMDDVLSAVGDVQTKANETAGKLDGMDREFLQKAADAATKGMEEIQQMKQRVDAHEKAQELLQKQFARGVPNAMPADGQDDPEVKQAFAAYLRKGREFSPETKQKAYEALGRKHFVGCSPDEFDMAVKSLSAGADPDGGYYVTPTRSATIVKRQFETSPIRQIASIESTNSDSLDVFIDDQEASDGGWVGEQETRSDTNTPTIGKLTIPVHEQYAQPKATQKLLDDAGVDIESWLSQKIADKLSRSENTAFVSGDGVAKPRGFLSYPAWASAGVYESGKVEQVASGSLGAFTADGLMTLQNSLKEAYQSRATWLTKRASFTAIIQLKNGDGSYLLDPALLFKGAEMQLLGKPVVFADDIPAIASNALAAAYGDFSVGYTIVDRVGVRVLRDHYTDKPFIKFYTTKRVGGALTSYEAIKIQKLAASL